MITTMKVIILTTTMGLTICRQRTEAAPQYERNDVHREQYNKTPPSAVTSNDDAAQGYQHNYGQPRRLRDVSNVITVSVDDNRNSNDKVEPAPFTSIFYSKENCLTATFPNQNTQTVPAKKRVSRMVDLSFCAKGLFPQMCDYNKDRLPQRITMIDCGRCDSTDGNYSGYNVRCQTTDDQGKTIDGFWKSRKLEIDLPFRADNGEAEYRMRMQVITVGCYCQPHPFSVLTRDGSVKIAM